MTQPTPTPAPAPPIPDDPAPASADPPTASSSTDDQPLGQTGQRALVAERDARKALERQLAELAPLKQLADLINGGQKPADGKSEVDLLNEKFTAYESQLADERQARWRAEVAAAKGLTPQQAARLHGASLEEFTTDADALLALFPAAPAGPRNPAPDPSQGARGGQPGPDLDARIAEATKAGDWRKAAALQKTKLATVPR